jgi:TonB family protein
MKLMLSILFVAVSALCAIAAVPTPKIVKLYPPTFPPLARTAGIFGTVAVKLSIARDGTVSSVQLVSGHPMLVEAAEESARKTIFSCEGCDHQTSYDVSFEFVPEDEGICPQTGPWPPSFYKLEAPNHVIVRTCSPVTDHGGDRIRAPRRRSIRCLYIWRCGEYIGARVAQRNPRS